MTTILRFVPATAEGGFALLNLLVGATGVLVVAATAVLLLRKHSAAARHLVWATAMLALLALPLLASCLPNLGPAWFARSRPSETDVTRSVASEISPASDSNVASTRSVSPTDEAASGPNGPIAKDDARPVVPVSGAAPFSTAGQADLSTFAARPSLLAGSIAFGVWLVGAVGGLLALMRLHFSTFSLRWRAVPVTDEDTVAIRDEIWSSGAVREAVPLLCSSEVSVPVATGVLYPAILLPAGFGKWTSERLRVVLAHEMTHVRRHDVPWQFLARLACCFYWPHPLVWLANRQMRIDREFACDDAVLVMGEAPSNYASHLIDVAAQSTDPAGSLRMAVAMASRGCVEQRVRAILHPTLSRTAVSRRGSRTLLAGALLLSAGVAMLSPPNDDAVADSTEIAAPHSNGQAQPASPTTNTRTRPAPGAAADEKAEPDADAIGASRWGTIKGRIVWGPDEFPLGAPLEVTKDREWCLQAGTPHEETWIVDPATKGLRNVFVYIEKPTAIHPDYPRNAEAVDKDFRKRFEEMNGFDFDDVRQLVADRKVKLRDIKSPAAIIDQVHCVFTPHAVAVREGQPVFALNPEPIAHNVKVASVSGRNDANPIIPPGTMQIFDWRAERSPMKIECSIHGWMKMNAMVFDHPYFTVTGKDGSFEFENVPAGELTLILRDPRYITLAGEFVRSAKKRRNKVLVKPNETTDLGVIAVQPPE